MRLMIRSFASVIVLASSVTLAKARTDDGRVSGTARDASGAVVPAATITVHNQKTGVERSADTNSDGYFLVTNLPPSTYTITGKSSGLGPTVYSDVDLQVGQERKVDLVLQLTAVNEQI